MQDKPKIMLVMHEAPYNSGFLAAKFLHLSKVFDTHLLVWSKRPMISRFIRKYNIPEMYGEKIHSGVSNIAGLLRVFIAFFTVVLFQNKVRHFVFSSGEGFVRKIKMIAGYLPIFTIKPDIVHFEFGTIANDLSVLKELTGAKMSVSFRGYDINYIGLDSPGYYDTVWKYADGFHFLGNDLKVRAMKRGYKPGKAEALIPPAVSTDFFNRGSSRVDGSNDKLKIVSAGRLVWKKGYEYGIRACALLKSKGVPFEYVIIGDGDFKQALQFTISELGLEDDVRLVGSKSPEELKQELLNADIFLHPAISEGFCNAVVEAQAMGVPVICSAADGLSENIEDGKTGFVVPVWDTDITAEKMAWGWNNKEQLKIMGIAGIKRVQDHFKIEDQVKAFTRFYTELYEQH